MSRFVSLAAALAVQAAFVAPAALAQESVKLNMVPLPSVRQQVDVTMDMKMNMSMQLPADAPEQARAQAEQMKATMPVTMQMAMRQVLSTTPKAADGSYTLKAEVNSLKSEMRDATGQVRPLPRPGPIRFTAQLRNDQIDKIDVELPPTMPTQQALSKEMQEKIFNQSFDWMRKFNGQTMKVGESVEMPIDLNLPTGGAPTGKVLGKYTLTAINKGVASFDLDMRMDMSFAGPAAAASSASAPEAPEAPASAASAPAPVQGAMTGSGKGKMDLRIADRLMLRSTMTMSMGMDMKGPQGNMRMDMDMAMAATGKALPAAKKAAPAKPATKG